MDSPLKRSLNLKKSRNLSASCGDTEDYDLEGEEGDYDGFDGSDEEFDEDDLDLDFDENVGSALAKNGEKSVQKKTDALKAQRKDCKVAIIPKDNDFLVRIATDVKYLDAITAKTWGVDISKWMIIELVIHGPKYMDGGKPPSVEVFQSGDVDPTKYRLSDISNTRLIWYLRTRLHEWLNLDTVWPPKDDNVLVGLLMQLTSRIMSCTSNCVICDSPLPCQMAKPAVCNQNLCLHSHESYGLGVDVSTEIRENPEVVELLIEFTKAASSGTDVRRFTPFPNGVEAEVLDEMKRVSKLSFLSNNIPNMGTVKEVISLIPSVEILSQYGTTKEVKEHLDRIHPLAFPLLRWVITSNRAYLVKLPAEDQIGGLQTTDQYLFVSSPPEKESLFQQLKKKKGSFWAFHGSGAFNWHSILRMGLKNFSNTPLMSAGAAYGAGIYMAQDSGTSFSYCARGYGGSAQLTCLALCEVINDGYKANPYYVVPKEEHVMTRYFFVYKSTNHNYPSVKAMELKNLKSATIEMTVNH